jgi:ADP-ribosylglycohydrolase
MVATHPNAKHTRVGVDEYRRLTVDASLKCSACGNVVPTTGGYLRPEGFVCGACWTERLRDPAFLRTMEGQLEGLIATVTGDSAGTTVAARDQAIAPPRTERDRRAFESLHGLAVADALGARFEGSDLDPARGPASIEHTEGIAPWTDDTQMALSLVEVLQRHDAIDQDSLAAAFAQRYQPWRGYGGGMRLLLEALREGRSWREARHSVFREGSFGNGSAMRAGPLGAYFHDARVDHVVAQAELSAEVTHSHPEGRSGAIAVALAAWLAARSRGATLRSGRELLGAVAAHLPPGLELTTGIVSAAGVAPDAPLRDAVDALGNGSHVSCQDTVPLSLWLALNHLDDYEGAVRAAIAAGGDTDTTAAIVGSIIAAHGGQSCIPARWCTLVETVPVTSSKAS